MAHKTKIGLFGIGLDAYWPQFAGLKKRLEGYLHVVEGKLAREGVEIVNLGHVAHKIEKLGRLLQMETARVC